MTWQFVRSEPGDDPIVVEAYFAAPPIRVFEAWTDPDIVMKWFGRAPNSLQSATIDLRPGGTWRFVELQDAEKTIGFEGEYVAIDPGARLVFTWSKVIAYATGNRDATPQSRVEVVFAAQGTGTRVRLVHSAVMDDATRKGFGGGWDFAFGTMRELLSLPQPT